MSDETQDEKATGAMTHDALSYCAWAYDRLLAGDVTAGKALLLAGLKRAKVEQIPKAPSRYHTPTVSKAPMTAGTGTPAAKPAGGVTAKVWEIADRTAEATGTGDIKVLRAAIMSACEVEGINKATAGTQYSKWKKAKNIS